jgi:tRNA 2-thiouridine synthesizing protein A
MSVERAPVARGWQPCGRLFIADEGGLVVTSADIHADQVLDCSGLLCPIPVVKTSKAIKEIEVGQVLQMIATDPGAPPDMEAWVRQTGHEMVAQSTEGDTYQFWFRRTK